MTLNCVGVCDATRDGYTVVHGIARTMGDCLYTPREIGAFAVGLSSLFFWIFFMIPQLLKNYRRGSTDALSPWVNFEWVMGNILNLIGAVLSKQRSTQIANGCLYIFMDIIFISQRFYYYFKNKKRGANGSPTISHGVQQAAAVIAISALPAVTEALDRVSCAPIRSESVIKLGWYFGWASTSIYIHSRIPQIYKNVTTGRTDGLSKKMYLCSVFGNLTYLTGVMLRVKTLRDVYDSLPWIVAATACCSIDFCILLHILHNKRKRRRELRESVSSSAHPKAVPMAIMPAPTTTLVEAHV